MVEATRGNRCPYRREVECGDGDGDHDPGDQTVRSALGKGHEDRATQQGKGREQDDFAAEDRVDLERGEAQGDDEDGRHHRRDAESEAHRKTLRWFAPREPVTGGFCSNVYTPRPGRGPSGKSRLYLTRSSLNPLPPPLQLLPAGMTDADWESHTRKSRALSRAHTSPFAVSSVRADRARWEARGAIGTTRIWRRVARNARQFYSKTITLFSCLILCCSSLSVMRPRR